SDYEIILPEVADTTLRKAAGQFQTYIEKISGIQIPIATEANPDAGKNKVFIGGNNNEALSPYSVIIKNEGENIVITGGSSQSVLHAVYEFLEKYAGCRWYSPEVEKIPTAKTISVQIPVNDIYTPEITTRTVHSLLFYDNPDFAD